MNPFLYSQARLRSVQGFRADLAGRAACPRRSPPTSSPVNSVKELIDLEKAKPGTFQIGVSTPTSQVTVGLLNMMAGTNLTMVPYSGGTTQITGMLAGDIPLGMESANVVVAALARQEDQDPRRSPAASGCRSRRKSRPSRETLPGLRPRHLAERRRAGRHAEARSSTRLYASLAKVMAMPDVREKLLAAGIEPTISKSPEEFAAFIKLAGRDAREGDQGGRDEARLSPKRRAVLALRPAISGCRHGGNRVIWAAMQPSTHETLTREETVAAGSDRSFGFVMAAAFADHFCDQLAGTMGIGGRGPARPACCSSPPHCCIRRCSPRSTGSGSSSACCCTRWSTRSSWGWCFMARCCRPDLVMRALGKDLLRLQARRPRPTATGSAAQPPGPAPQSDERSILRTRNDGFSG